jgi:hypothetical protein
MNREILTLSNGKRVANFSSPHVFLFEDGSVLSAVSGEHATSLSLIISEDELNDKGDISIEHSISPAIEEEIEFWKAKHEAGEVDVVFCPFPMMQALWHNCRENLHAPAVQEYMESMPFRSILTANRLTKEVSIHKQCL